MNQTIDNENVTTSRPVWSGSIGFGLVDIPVKAYSATRDSELDLDMLDRSDNSNIRYLRVNASTGKEVPYENIVRGYKYGGRYVVLEESDFARAAAAKSQVIAIEEFVKEKEIDRLYYETAYYLEPEGNAAHAYKLFCEALKQTGKVGVATFVMRSKEHLAIIRPEGDVLILFRMRFAEEIRQAGALHLPTQEKTNSKELEMAVTLIDSLTAKFDITRYHDSYTNQLMDVIKAKAKGARIIPFEPPKAPPKAGDLMSQLRASLNAKQKKSAS